MSMFFESKRARLKSLSAEKESPMRKAECDALIAKIQDMAVSDEQKGLKLELIEQIVKADPHELALLEKALKGEPVSPAQPGGKLDTVFVDDVEEFSHQLKAIIKKKGYTTLADLAKRTEAGLREDGFQDGTIDKIRAALAKHGHTLE